MQGQDRILPRDQELSVEVKSDFDEQKIKTMREEAVLHGLTVNKIIVAAQCIPFIGRLIAHAPANYWVWLMTITLSMTGC